MTNMRTWEEGEYIHEATYHALAPKVMAFAVANVSVGDWAAYIDAVPGIVHDKEFDQLLEKGMSAKLSYDIAKIIFSSYDKKYIWRN
jgi:hypothetical protein